MMKKKCQTFGSLTVHKCFVILLLSVFGNTWASEKPNVVFFLIDDMGWKDLGCFGAKVYETPNIDKLCAQGMKFPAAYTSAPICSPARASALSGIHSLKLGMWNHEHYIPPKTPIISQYLKKQGYATWHIGKWHLGNPEDKSMPTDLGYDVNVGGFTSWGPGSYFWPYGVKIGKNGEKEFYHRNAVPGLYEGGKKGEYLTDRLTNETLKLLDKHDSKQALYLNFWTYGVHHYHEGKADLVKKYKEKMARLKITEKKERKDPVTGRRFVTTESNPVYAAMIESIDQSVGKIVAKLKEKGMYENTLFVFYSDNGSVTDSVPCTPLMGGKNSTYEAGIRVPAFVTWPGKIPAGQVNETPIIIMDIAPTILEAAGMKIPEGWDGISLSPHFQQQTVPDREFIWYFPDDRLKWGQRVNMAMRGRDGKKYIMFFNGDKAEMYDLKKI